MSREIGFRVWSENQKKYLDPICKDYEFAIICACNSGETYIEYSDDIYTIEQDTGLKDKNGKRIREGDIVKKYDDGDIAPIIGVVEFCKSGARFGVSGGRFILSQRWEVIGNIHENPELLEEGK